jgi:hypothetical protein
LDRHRKFFLLMSEAFSSELAGLPEPVYLLNLRKLALSVQQVDQERAQVAEVVLTLASELFRYQMIPDLAHSLFYWTVVQKWPSAMDLLF